MIKSLSAISAAAVISCFGQTVTLQPTCGKPGDNVCLSGAGWAEPNPVCRYTFAFDGVTVAPDQPDGLFGPPITNFIVPAATDGNHNVRVQLRLNSPDNLLQERTVPFKVVSAPKDPWTASTTSGATINLKFDPTDICDLGSCDKIVFLQVDRRVGVKDDGTEVGQPDSNWGFDAKGDKDLTTDFYIVDRVIGKKEPYYGGNGILTGGGTGSSTPGSSVPGSIKTATLYDKPSQTDGSFPAGFKGTRLEFETAAFCAVGAYKGKYLGTVKWKWEKTKGGGAGTTTIISKTRAQPSAKFLEALNIWTANKDHPFTIPTAAASPCP